MQRDRTDFPLNASTAKSSVAMPLVGTALLAVALSVRESIDFPQTVLGVLLLVGVLIAVLFRISASAFACWSFLFDMPILSLAFAGTEVRLFHIVAIFIMLRALWKTAKGRKVGLAQFDVAPLLFILAVALFGLIPGVLAGTDYIESSLRFHLEISLAFALGYIIFYRTNLEKITSLTRQLSVALATVYLYWLGSVSLLPEIWSESIDINRTSHFVFPMSGSHIGTGVFLISLIFLLYVKYPNLAGSRIDLTLMLLLSAAISSSSSRGATLLLFAVNLGLILSVSLSRKRQDWKAPLLVSAGWVFGSLELERPGGTERHTVVDDFLARPILEDDRIQFAFNAFGHLQEIWQAGNVLEILFGIGYGRTLERFGVSHDAHNDFLTTLIERGLLGSLLAFTGLYIFARTTLTVYRHQPLMLLTLWASVVGIGALGLTGMAAPVFLILGGVFASRPRPTPLREGSASKFQSDGVM